MSTWTNIANSLVAIGARPRASLIAALRDNVIAAMIGAPGAPRLQLAALAEPAAGDIVKLGGLNTLVQNNTTTFVAVQDYFLMQTGSIRVQFRHRAGAGGGTSEARVLRDGVTIASWTVTGNTFQVRAIDTAIAPGSRITVQHRGTGIAGAISEIDLVSGRTTGTYLWPIVLQGVEFITP